MEKQSVIPARYLAASTAVIVGLYITSLYNYLLFHSVVETFSIVVSCGIFMVVWNARRMLDNNYFLFLGIAYLFVGGVDLLHALSYKGMGVFPESDANLPTQLWIAGRYVQGVSLLLAPFCIGRRPKPVLVLCGYAAAVSLLLLSILYWRIFPDCYLEGTGLTPFKRSSEYLICLILSGSLVLLFRRRRAFDGGVFKLLTASIAMSIASGLAFVLYMDVYGLFNLIGHFFRLTAFYLIYRAIIETGFLHPYNLLFMHLKQNEAELLLANTELEDRVRERTSELDRTNAALRDEIAERKRAEDALQIERKRLFSLLDELPALVFLQASDYSIRFANRYFRERFGATGEKPCYNILHGRDLPCEECPTFRIFETGSPIAWEWIASNDRTYQISAYPFTDVDGSKLVLELGIDISDLKRAEEENRSLQLQLLQAQKLDSLGKLAGGVAHDFNNLISAVIGFSELVLERLPEGQPAREYVQIIHDVGGKAAGLTRQLLAFSRKQMLEMKTVNLNSVVENLGRMLHRVIGEDVVLKFSPQVPLNCVLADPGQMEQILLNLAINARDAMPAGGRLTVETAEVELDEEYARVHEGVKPGAYVILTVTDTGEGMSREVRERIFEPFFTTKEQGKGTGLGLATVYGIVRQHNGHIWVYSEPGMGSTFKIYLPAVEEEGEEQVRREPQTVKGGSETVLVVDDEPYIRRLVMETLTPLGYRILEAATGEEALRVSDMHVGSIDLLLTDVIMPGMNGRQLAEMFTARRPATKVVFMSGYTDSYIAQHGVLDPAVAFIQKPLAPGALTGKVREALDSEGKRGEGWRI